LVEQIISSHSLVTGAGELTFARRFAEKLFQKNSQISQPDVESFRLEYLNELNKIPGRKQYVIDKMPHNFRFLPLLINAFPEAKIVHVKRNPAATCWSNFKTYFAGDGLGYSYDLSDISAYYNLYKKITDHWTFKYTDLVVNCDYETLTSHPHKETKILISELNLEWENSCLKPHLNKRPVSTASQRQVRNPIYRNSSKNWEKYIKYINGAFDILENI